MRTAPVIVTLLFAAASGAEPLPEDDNGPLTGGFGLPGIAEGGNIVAAGRFATSLSVIAASHAIVEDLSDESLIFDGETIRALVDIRYGLLPGIELGIELPYVSHRAGRLDSLIDTWHDIFNLPEGARDNRPTDELEFSYRDGAVERLRFTDGTRGIGDVRLYAGVDLASTEKHRRALRISAKLPTGDADKLLGSGGTDVSLGFAGDVTGDDSTLSVFYRASLTYVGEPERLPDLYRELVGQASAGFAYSLHPRFALNAQSTFRTAVYESDIEVLGEPSLTLTFGGTIGLGDKWTLALGVSEDIKVNSAPDVTFNIGLRYRP